MIRDLNHILLKYDTFIYFEDLEIKEHKINLSRINDFYINRKEVSIKFLIPYSVGKELYECIEYELDSMKNKNYGIKVMITTDKQVVFGDRIITISFDFNTKIDSSTLNLTGSYSEIFINDLNLLFKIKDLNKIVTTKYFKNRY